MKKYFWILCLLFLCAGCGKKDAFDPSAEVTKEPLQEEWRDLVPTEVKKETDITKLPSQEEMSLQEGVPEGSSVALTGLVMVGEDGEYYCDVEGNVFFGYRYWEPQHLVCKDPVYGITYYINVGRNQYIYAFREEKSELTVAIPAKTLYCREGKLYFLAMEEKKIIYEWVDADAGRVLVYDPTDGTVQPVFGERLFSDMAVYPDGIYVCERIPEEVILPNGEKLDSYNEQSYFYSFTEKELKKSGQNGIARFGGLLVEEDWSGEATIGETGATVSTLTGYDFYDRSGEKAFSVELPSRMGVGMLRVDGTKLYYLARGDKMYHYLLMEYDTATGERRECYEIKSPRPEHGGFIRFGNLLYTQGGARLDLSDGSCSLLEMSLKKQDYDMDNTAWYTDGENLFYFSGRRLFLYKETAKRDEIISIPYTDETICTYEYNCELIALGE